jgi:hypothetical protein
VQHLDTSSFADNSIAKEGTPPGLPPTSSAQAVGMPESLEILGLAPERRRWRMRNALPTLAFA